jgi:DNA processing protein
VAYSDERYYLIALTLIPGIGTIGIHKLLAFYGSATAIFHAHPDLPWDFPSVDATITFCRKHGVHIWCHTDPEYPFNLTQITDRPTVLYFKGSVDLNHPRILSIVGTRLPSQYGKQIVSDIVRHLATYDILVVSGLADGIDALAHQAALTNGIPTIGVLAHGLDTIYPTGNRKLAKDLLTNGGLLTEYIQGTRPEAFRFPLRNRIIAGLATATIVIESALEGGSMITAKLARVYDREVFAIPGRTTDNKSGGCNVLIRDNIAAIATSAVDIMIELNWEPRQKATACARLASPLLDLLSDRDWVHIDELRARSGLSPGDLATKLLELELAGNVVHMPGNRYRLSS